MENLPESIAIATTSRIDGLQTTVCEKANRRFEAAYVAAAMIAMYGERAVFVDVALIRA